MSEECSSLDPLGCLFLSHNINSDLNRDRTNELEHGGCMPPVESLQNQYFSLKCFPQLRYLFQQEMSNPELLHVSGGLSLNSLQRLVLMIHNGRMMNICGCCNLGRQRGKKWTVVRWHVQVGTKETNPWNYFSLSQKRALHPLVLTGRTGPTVLKPPLWLVALFWLFVKCSFPLVHSPLGFKKK